MLLSNLTASSAACSTLLSIKVSVIPDSRLSNSLYTIYSRCGSCPAPVPYPTGETREILALPLLVDAFVQGSQVVESGDLSKRTRKAELHFLASVFANLTVVRIFVYASQPLPQNNDLQSPAGRNFFLSPQPTDVLKSDSSLEYILAKLVPFTEHKDKIRRGGVASTIKQGSFPYQLTLLMTCPEIAHSTLRDTRPFSVLSPKQSRSHHRKQPRLELMHFRIFYFHLQDLMSLTWRY